METGSSEIWGIGLDSVGVLIGRYGFRTWIKRDVPRNGDQG